MWRFLFAQRRQTWADTTTPNGFTRGDIFGTPREYWQAGGDTSVAWDTKGNSYLSCQLFNRGNAVSPNPDQSSGFFLFRSTHTDGASFNFPGRPVEEANDTAGAGNVLIDKALMTVDDHPASRFADRIYVSWTTFAADGTGYIYEAFSDDYGESFSGAAQWRCRPLGGRPRHGNPESPLRAPRTARSPSIYRPRSYVFSRPVSRPRAVCELPSNLTKAVTSAAVMVAAVGDASRRGTCPHPVQSW
jgi:hypothetical protein